MPQYRIIHAEETRMPAKTLVEPAYSSPARHFPCFRFRVIRRFHIVSEFPVPGSIYPPHRLYLYPVICSGGEFQISSPTRPRSAPDRINPVRYCCYRWSLLALEPVTLIHLHRFMRFCFRFPPPPGLFQYICVSGLGRDTEEHFPLCCYDK